MIDEFQDTSGMQWNNFRPLVEEESGEWPGQDLIVGDVKQSIYRFRNSGLEAIGRASPQDFEDEQVREDTLKDNWRSCRHIVEFNNAFFTAAPAILQDLYNEALKNSSLKARKSARPFREDHGGLRR